MSLLDLPLNRAHQHAANAEDHRNNGLLVLAAEEHARAAEAYLAAIERSHDESAKRTLRMLYDEHCKAGKELHRKIDKLKQDGKDPNLPYKQGRPVSPVVRGLQVTGSQNTQRSATSAPSRPVIDTVDESFMLLGGQRSDPGDAFNQFWNIMQEMLDTLSQPVAFASVPLMIGAGKSPPGVAKSTLRYQKKDVNTSDTEFEDSIYPPTDNHNSTLSSDEFEDLNDFKDEDDMSDSFYLVSTESGSTPATLKRENARLRAEVESLQLRLDAMHRVIQLRKEQDLQLRDSIFQATREAQRVMGTSTVIPRPAESNSLNPPVSSPSLTSSREAQYMRRVKELEEDARNLRSENEKNKAIITKYKERWEKLKESAKRKKEDKARVTSISSLGERIVEEPEVEEQLDYATSANKL